MEKDDVEMVTQCRDDTAAASSSSVAVGNGGAHAALYAKYCDELPPNPAADAFYAHAKGILSEVWDILAEAYNFNIIATKLLPTIRIRFLKVIGMVVNQRIGALCCGWNGHENRIYDRVGFLTDLLFLKLYRRPLQQREVILFLHRRLHYAFITAVFTTVQIILTWQGYVGLALVVSCVLVPVTMIDRQWATSVTKNPPRYQREVILNHLHWPIDSMLAQSANVANGSVHPMTVDPRFSTYTPPQRVRWPRTLFFLSAFEMGNGFIQFWCGAALFILPGLMIVSTRVRNFHVSASISMLVVLNVFRVLKELANWISPGIEWVITPMKYAVSDRCLQELLTALGSVPLELLIAVISCGSNKEIKYVNDSVVEEHRSRLQMYVERLQGGNDALAAATTTTAEQTKPSRLLPAEVKYSTLPHFLQRGEVLSKDQIVTLCVILEAAMKGVIAKRDPSSSSPPPLDRPLLADS